MACLAIASGARAQDSSAREARAHLEQARAGLESADFGTADRALDRAAQGSMSRAELLEWLELRALLAYADQRLGALDETLRAYASLVPTGAAPPPSFPGPVRARLAELQAEARSIRVAAHVGSDGARREIQVAAEVLDDPGHLVRRTRVRARIGRAPLRELAAGQSLSATGDVHRELRVAYVVDAYGPGGAWLTSAGSARAPREVTVAGLAVDQTPLVVGATIAGVTVALGIIALVVAAAATDGFREGASTVVHGPGLPLLSF